MFFDHHHPLQPRKAFARRLAAYFGIAVGIVVVSLIIGVVGYRIFAGFSWIDSLLNASMILGGMGPINEITSVGGKLFASFYALFSGIVFLVAVAVFLAPILHRLLHHFHLDSIEKEKPQSH
jgi:hypothetical protein